MVSLRRRQVIIGGLVTVVAPAVSFAARERLLLSGRIVGADGKALAGATVAAGGVSAATDADGRFMLVTTTPIYRVTCNGHATEGFVSNRRRDPEGTWRATVGLTLA